MSSRQAGWAAVLDMSAAQEQYYRWNEGAKMSVPQLIQARDFCAMSGKSFSSAKDEINVDLRKRITVAVRGAK